MAIKGMSVKDIMKLELEPVQFVVEDFFPQGLTILASPPKYGKSWLVMDLCISVANGTEFLGKKTNKCDTLYLALEDSVNRIYDRIKKVTNGTKLPSNCVITTHSETLAGSLVQDLDNYKKEHPDLKLVVIDTLQKIRGTQGKSENAYAYDYKELGELKKFADRNKICLVLVHHLRKLADDGDVFNRMSGTAGITGAADTMIALSRKKRSDEDTTLSITGRDVECNDIIVNFNKTTYKWEIVGDAEYEAEKRLLEQYKQNPVAKLIKEVVNFYHGEWKGTATELINFGVEKNGVLLPLRPNELGKEFRKIKNNLYNIDDIIYVEPNPNGSNGTRKHTFRQKGYTIFNNNNYYNK